MIMIIIKCACQIGNGSEGNRSALTPGGWRMLSERELQVTAAVGRLSLTIVDWLRKGHATHLLDF